MPFLISFFPGMLGEKEKKIKVPPRFELGLQDSESWVLTITPWDLSEYEGLDEPMSMFFFPVGESNSAFSIE